MPVGRLTAAAIGFCLVAVSAAAGLAPTAAPAAVPTAAPAAATPALAGVSVRPGVIHVGRAQAGLLSTADCEKLYQVACYGPAQICTPRA